MLLSNRHNFWIRDGSIRNMHARTTPINISRHVERSRSRLQKSAAHANPSRDDALVKGDKVVDREKQRQAERFIGRISDGLVLLLLRTKVTFLLLIKSVL